MFKKLLFVLFVVLTANAYATTSFTQGVNVSGSTATIWFASATTMSQVIVHYQDGSAAQQNVNMTYNSSAAQWQTSFTVATGDLITYSFTYTPSGGLATDSGTYSYTVGGQTATPTFSPAGGTYTSAQSVTLSDTTSGATIYYTTDGSTPTTASTQYTAAISVSATTTIKAIAAASGMSNSNVASATYTISNQVATPTFSPGAGSYTSTQSVTISDATSGATIYYTTDGTTPTTASTKYTGAISVAASETINAIGVATGLTNSAVGSAAYTISTGPFTQGVSVSGSTATIWFASATTMSQVIVHYQDASQPQQNVNMTYNSAAAQWQTSFTVSTGDLITYSFTYTPSGGLATNSGTYTYTVGGQTATPTFSPAPGTYTSAQSVTLSDTTSGATIYYTTDGSTPTTASTKYTAAISVSATTTIKAIAAASGMSNSNVASGTYTISTQVATPTFSPGAGSYTSTQSVTISDATSGATIYYTTDGTTPTTSSTKYTGAISVAASETINAIGVATGLTNSAVGSAAYTISSGPFTQGVSVSGSTATIWFASSTTMSQVIVHYQDASQPQQNVNMTYNSAAGQWQTSFTVSAGDLITYSFTYTPSGGLATNSGTYTYTVGGQTATPTFSPAPGTYSSTQSVTLSDSTSGATIYYTTDGSTPTTSSTKYTAAISVAATTTIKAIAAASGMSNSNVASGTYTIGGQVATPTFSPAAGSYSSAQSVTISDTTSGATIYYTTDGTTPTTSSTKYTAAISVSTSETIKAIGVASGLSNSAVASAAYTISSNTFTQGVDPYGNSGTIWFASNPTATSVTVHYAVNGGTQQNVAMSYNSSTARYEFSVGAGPGDTIAYFFTYNLGSGALDSPNYTYKMPTSVAATPTFSPGAGTYVSAQTVTLATTTSGGVIHYTTDGSTPTSNSPVYSSPLTVSTTEIVNAVTTASGMSTSAVGSAMYTIGQVAPPTFSPLGGTYTTAQSVTMTDSSSGATIYYTTDGSTPTTASTKYTGPVSISSGTVTLKAIAAQSGAQNSSVTSDIYKINTSGTWDGTTTFNLVNATNGAYADSQVYWCIIGRDWTSSSNFVHVTVSGNTGTLTQMSLSDNTVAINGSNYANYCYTLAQCKSVVIPAINSARIYFSVGKPVYLQVNTDINGNLGYAGPNIDNSSDVNLSTIFDFGEFAILPPTSSNPGFFGNLTRVDMFGIPMQLRLQGLDGFDQTVGETETRAQLFSEFQSQVPAAFAALGAAPYAPYRIVAPIHGSFGPGGANANYFDAYIQSVWNYYTTNTLTFTDNQGTFNGHVVNNVFQFTDGLGTYYINGVPTTQDVFAGYGLLNDPSGTTAGSDAYNKQLQIQAQICAAFHRHIVQDPTHWYTSSYFYQSAPADYYSWFWHQHNLRNLAYGFCYDDVGSFAAYMQDPVPSTVTFTIEW